MLHGLPKVTLNLLLETMETPFFFFLSHNDRREILCCVVCVFYSFIYFFKRKDLASVPSTAFLDRNNPREVLIPDELQCLILA